MTFKQWTQKTMKPFFKKISVFVAVAFCAFSVMAQSDPRIKALLQEALRLYSERQYVRALDLFNQVQRIDPQNATASEYIESSKQRIEEWESQGGDFGATRKPAATWDSLLKPNAAGVETFSNAKDIIAARRSLVERMKNRSVNADNIVKIEDSKKGMNVTLYHDQLFLPGLSTLRDESLPILSNVAALVKTSGERDITIRSISTSDSKDPFLLFPDFPQETNDPSLPQMSRSDSPFLFQDIETTRAFILFTYIAQQSMVPKSSSLE